MRSKGFAVIGLLVAASMILAACGTATPQTVVQTVVVAGTPQVIEVTTTPGPEAAKPKSITMDLGVGDIPTIDPSLTQDTNAVQVVEETTVGLTRANEVTSVAEPGLAAKWDISADGLTYTFHLTPGVPWVKYDPATGKVVKVQGCPDANGATKDRTVTAQDFAFGILRTLDPKTASPYAYVWNFVLKGGEDFNSGKAKDASAVGVKVVDDNTLEMTFLYPFAYDIQIAGMWVGRAEPSWLINGDDCTTAVGDKWTETGNQQSYGPYTMKEWVHNSELTLVANPFWPATANVPTPKIEQVVFTMLDEPAAFAEYEAGNMDTTPAPLADMDRIKADPTLSKELTLAPNMCTYVYGFNTKAKYVDDVRVRMALSEAIDRQSLIDNVTKANQEPAQWLSRPGLAGSPTMADHPDLGVKYNPTDAKAQLDAYLKEKNLTADKLDLTLMYNTNAGHQKIAEAIQQMWKTNLGIDVKVTSQEWKVFLETIKDPVNTPQIFRIGWCQDYPDANNFVKDFIGVGGNNNPTAGGGLNWKDQKYEDLITQAAKEQDPAKRVDLYAQAEEILNVTDAAIIPIYWYTRATMTKPYLTRTFSAASGLEHIEKWDVNK